MANATTVFATETTKLKEQQTACDFATVAGKRGIDILHDPTIN
jgi:hypothetical protein